MFNETTNEIIQNKRLNAVDAVDAVDAVSQQADGWSTPTPLHSVTLPPVMPLTSEMLPNGIRDAILNHAERLNNASPDFTAQGVIASIAALVAGSIEIKPKQNDPWTVCPVLFSCSVGNASKMKTPSLELGMKHIERVQKAISDKQNDNQSIEFEIKMQIFKETEKSLKSSLKLAYETGDTEEIRRIMTELNTLKKPNKPFKRNILINDCTVEALCIRLSENPAGLLYFRDEFSGWLASIEQKGREHERPFFLECFNGSTSKYVQERIGRENIVLERRIVHLLGGIQPKLLAPLIKSKITGFKDDGLLERVLLFSVFPDTSPLTYSDTSMDYDAEFLLADIFNILAKMHRPFDRITFSFESDAQNLWNDWSIKALEEQVNLPEEWQSLWSKRPAMCAKLALLFHIIDQAEIHSKAGASSFEPNLKIQKDCLYRALIWMKYLKSHTKKIFSLVNNGCCSVPAANLLAKLDRLYPRFTKHQLSQKNWKGLTNSESREEALKVLIKAGYLREVEEPNKHYIVHPDYSISKAA
ncbi:TPA: DUF3987 domain-containing protein [Vibrio diabolicus]